MARIIIEQPCEHGLMQRHCPTHPALKSCTHTTICGGGYSTNLSPDVLPSRSIEAAADELEKLSQLSVGVGLKFAAEAAIRGFLGDLTKGSE